MIKLKKLLNEIALPPSSPKDAMEFLSQLIQTMDQDPTLTDPVIAQDVMRQGIQHLAGLSKVLMLGTIYRNRQVYERVVNLLKRAQEKLSRMFVYWAEEFDKKRGENNQRKTETFYNFIVETAKLLTRSIEQYVDFAAEDNPESKGAYLIGVKKDIEQLNDMYARMIPLIDDLFQVYVPKGKFSTDMRTIVPDSSK